MSQGTLGRGSTNIAVAEGIKVQHPSPVTELARALVDAGHHLDTRLECWRGETLCLTGRLGWLAAHIFTEGASPVHVERHRPPAAGSARSETCPARVDMASHTGDSAPQAPDHRTGAAAAVGDNTSHHESADNYRHVVLLIGRGWRVIFCREPAQWIVQRRAGRQWRGVSFCTTRAVLFRDCRRHVGPLPAKAEAALARLPERAVHFKKTAAPEGERGRLYESSNVINTDSTADQE